MATAPTKPLVSRPFNTLTVDEKLELLETSTEGSN